MQLYYLRHAESTNNRLFRLTGAEVGRVCDPEITDLGRQQAERLGEFLAGPSEPAAAGLPAADPLDAPDGAHTPSLFDPQNRAGFGLTHLYCSLMERAVATGTLVAARLGLPLRAWPDWHEEGGVILAHPVTGEIQGQPGYNRPWFQTHYPELELPEALGEAGWWDNRPLEPAADRTARARRALAELRARHGGTADRVGIVSHGGFINHIVAALRGPEAPGPLSHLLNNCSVTRIDFQPDGRAEIIYQNRVDFLPTALIT